MTCVNKVANMIRFDEQKRLNITVLEIEVK